jgi:hypothetical protein
VNRTPPIEVRRTLRREVGFGCPADGCANPYLYWHHFDPPWSERQHHGPGGLIALCGEHHAKTDAGSYTKEQLHQLKERPFAKGRGVAGRFDWLRHELLLVVGGNFYLRTPIAVKFRDAPVVWLTRDAEEHALLNVSMLTTAADQPRMVMQESFWLSEGNPDDLECPPSGRLVSVEYSGGDYLRVEFFELPDADALGKRYPEAHWSLALPMTAVEVQMRVGGTELEFGPRETRLPGSNIIRGCLMTDCGAGIAIG